MLRGGEQCRACHFFNCGGCADVEPQRTIDAMFCQTLDIILQRFGSGSVVLMPAIRWHHHLISVEISSIYFAESSYSCGCTSVHFDSNTDLVLLRMTKQPNEGGVKLYTIRPTLGARIAWANTERIPQCWHGIHKNKRALFRARRSIPGSQSYGAEAQIFLLRICM